MHDGLREVELRFGQPDELDRARSRVGDDERERIGHPDVFGREDHEPARDETRVFSGFEHARQPVEAGVGSEPRIDLMKADTTS